MATNYILTVNFTEQGIDVLRRAGQQVAVVRDVTPSRPGDIAWLTFFPRTVSTVTWTEEDYYLNEIIAHAISIACVPCL